MLTVRVPERDRNKCERVTGPKPERVRSIFAGVNATRTSPNRCEHGLRGKHLGEQPMPLSAQSLACLHDGQIALFYI